MNKIEAPKELAVSTGCATSVEDVTGTSIVDVLQFMYKNFPGADRLGDLVVTSVSGSAESTTKITVAPSLTSGNTYAYTVGQSEVPEPDYLSDGSGYTTWGGVSDIVADDGHYVAIFEINPEKQIVKFGQTKATINLG